MPLAGLPHANKYDQKDSPAEKEMRVRTREHVRNEGSRRLKSAPLPPSSPSPFMIRIYSRNVGPLCAPSSVPMVSAPLIANFMFPVPDASLPAVEICSDKSAAG